MLLSNSNNQNQSKNMKITVFQVNNETFEQVGEIAQFTSLLWHEAYVGKASFELWCPVTPLNLTMVQQDYIIWTGEESAGIIESIELQTDQYNNRTFHVKGRTLEKLLMNRAIWGGYTNSGYTSSIMYDLVDKCCINPTNTNRTMPFMVNATDEFVGKQIAQYQKTGGSLYDALELLAKDAGLGFKIVFDPYNSVLTFTVVEGKDRTYGNIDGNDPVVLSSDFDDLLSSTSYKNNDDVKNVAFVQGEESGAERKSVTTGSIDSVGYERLELYVDARDLQSTVFLSDGTSTTLTEEEYLETLTARGTEKLAQHQAIETFEGQVRFYGDLQFQYGEDYFLGDTVTVEDQELGIRASAQVTSIEKAYSEIYELRVSFGYSYPTVIEKLNRTQM